MTYTTTLAGRAACDEHARAFVSRWSAQAGGELGNFALFYIELAEVLGLPRPEPNVGGAGDYVFEKLVTYPDGSRGRADLFKSGCCVIEAKCFGRAPSNGHTHATRTGRRRLSVRRGTPAWERAMRAAARQGARYARALAAFGSAPPFVVAADIGFSFDLYYNPSGTGRAYVPYPGSRRLLVADLVRADVRETLRLVLSDPSSLYELHGLPRLGTWPLYRLPTVRSLAAC